MLGFNRNRPALKETQAHKSAYDGKLYHPERHYMRGKPGPAHQSKESSLQQTQDGSRSPRTVDSSGPARVAPDTRLTQMS